LETLLACHANRQVPRRWALPVEARPRRRSQTGRYLQIPYKAEAAVPTVFLVL
jgi:hypothetical protein